MRAPAKAQGFGSRGLLLGGIVTRIVIAAEKNIRFGSEKRKEKGENDNDSET